ncbi:MAG TPA: hypothetical protein VGH28_24405 [Polyangiaceae bacterium]|jgi:hypothetical protein
MRAIRVGKRVALAGLIAAVSIACELVVGIGDDAHLAGDAGSDVEAGPSVCTLPATGDAQVRLASLVPSLDTYDFCLTPTSGQSPASGVLASSGSGCPTGLAYRNVLAPFAVASGSYRVDAVAPGAPCSSTPLATAPSVNFDPSTTTTVVLFGTASGAQLQLKSFREEKGTISDPKVRFINGWSDGPSSLECGIASSDELPTSIVALELEGQGAAFGSVAAQSPIVDPFGYFSVIGGVTVPFAFAETGKGTTGGVAVARDMTTFGSLSTFAIGTSSDPRFPVDLMICNQDQTDGVFTRCSNQVPDDVIVTEYNVQLQGRFTPTEADRRTAVASAIAGLDADFACITEVWDEADVDAITQAAKAHFPYVARFTTDWTTKPNDPRDQSGNVPPPYTNPPCDATSGPWSQAFLDCLAQNCTTGTPGDPNGQLVENATQCVVSNCLNEGVTVIQDPGCYSCDVTQTESGVSFATTQSSCTTNPLARYAYNGDTGVMLLSTHPFLSGTQSDAGAPDGGLPPDDAPGLWVFPATEYRAGVIRAPVDLTAGTTLSTKLDVYCAILTTPATGAERPYTGNYGGGGTTSADQWLAENVLQANQLVSFVTSTSGARKRRAIIAGDYYTGPALGSLQALNQQSFDTLTKSLPLAMAPSYSPACTLCGDNPLVNAAGSGNESVWSSYSLLNGLAVPEVQSNTVVLKELTATTNLSEFGGDAGALQIPPSFYYGMRTVVRVRP